jgi:threonine/homoserine/homoserine lactone efflux protein
MSLNVMLAFFAASFVLAITPGPTMSLVIANSTTYGRRAGLLTVFGNLTGLSILLTAVIFGLSSIMVFMSEWFDVLRWLGAAYLFYLGARTLWKLRTAPPEMTEAATTSTRWYWQGLFVALSNPKVLLFLGAFLPQFLDPAQPAFGQLVILAGIFVATLAGVDCLYAIAVARARQALSGRRRRIVAGTTGVLLIAGGLWIAAARRAA